MHTHSVLLYLISIILIGCLFLKALAFMHSFYRYVLLPTCTRTQWQVLGLWSNLGYSQCGCLSSMWRSLKVVRAGWGACWDRIVVIISKAGFYMGVHPVGNLLRLCSQSNTCINLLWPKLRCYNALNKMNCGLYLLWCTSTFKVFMRWYIQEIFITSLQLD